MSFNKPEFYSQFYNGFSELFKLYDEVKKIVLLAEYENKQQKYLITSVNELRNTLDHVMRIIPDNTSLTKNIEKAKGHLYRAGYDAYEIVAISKLNEIKFLKEVFSYDALIEAYPAYHSNVIPATEKAKKKLVEARAHKQIDTEIKDPSKEKKHFEDFETIVKELTSIVDDIYNHVEGIKEAEVNLKKRRQFYKTTEFWIGTVLVTLILGMIIAIFSLFTEYRFFTKSSSSQPTQTNPVSTVSKSTPVKK